MVVFQVVPYHHCVSSAIRVMFSTFGVQLLGLCYTVVVFLLVILYKRYKVYYFLTPLFLRSTLVKYVINVVVRTTPRRSELPQFVTKRLFLAGEQTE